MRNKKTESVLACAWFAGCRNRADFLVPHPVLGNVPCCKRCGDRLELAPRLPLNGKAPPPGPPRPLRPTDVPPMVAAKMKTATAKELVAAVSARLREEWGISAIDIPEDRLRDEVTYLRAEGAGDSARVTVKIPSRSEFNMSLAEARAVLSLYGR